MPVQLGALIMLTTTERQYRARDMARYHAMMETGDVEGAKRAGRLAYSEASKAGETDKEARRLYQLAHRRHLRNTSDYDKVCQAMRDGWKSERGF